MHARRVNYDIAFINGIVCRKSKFLLVLKYNEIIAEFHFYIVVELGYVRLENGLKLQFKEAKCSLMKKALKFIIHPHLWRDLS